MTWTVEANLSAAAAVATQEAILVSKNLSDLRQCVTVKPCPQGTVSVKFSQYAIPAASAVGAGNVASILAMTAAGVTLTPAVGAAVGFQIPDVAGNLMQASIDAGQAIAAGVVAKRNDDIFTAMLTATTAIGATDQALAETSIRSGVSSLMRKGALPGNLFLVCPVSAYEQLMNIYSTNTSMTSNFIRDTVMTTGFMPSIFGVTPVVYNKATDTNAQYAVLLDKRGVGFAETRDVFVEMQRVPTYVGYEAVGSAIYAAGLVTNDLVVKIGYKG